MDSFVVVFMSVGVLIAGIWLLVNLNKASKTLQEDVARHKKVADKEVKEQEERDRLNDKLNPMIDLWFCPTCRTPNCADEKWVKHFGLTDNDGKPLGTRCSVCFHQRTGTEEVNRMRMFAYQMFNLGKDLLVARDNYQKTMLNNTYRALDEEDKPT